MNMKYNIKVSESDFGTEGTFRARLSDIWTAERSVNPEFGPAKGKVRFASTTLNTSTMPFVMGCCNQRPIPVISNWL